MNRSLAQYLQAYQGIAHSETIAAIKVALLRSFSCETLEQPLAVDLFERLNLRPAFFWGGFNQYAQEILNTGGALYQFAPDYTFILVQIEDLCPDVFERCYEITEPGERIDQAVDEFAELVSGLRKALKSEVIVCNFTAPYFAHYAAYHAQRADGVLNLVARANLRLSEQLPKNNVYILDLGEIIRRLGTERAYAPKLYMLAQNPYSFPTYAALSQKAAGVIAAILGRRKKCIVLDLDNTLWKGIIGEDGAEGIEISEPFRLFQAQLLKWNQTGVLLAVCSKNNPGDAMNIIRDHPDMILRASHFAALRINWENKADNIAALASELNIGLDSLIFIDDSAFECGLVREALPEVEVIQLTGQVETYADMAKNISSLDFLRLTEEDRARAAEYNAQKRRAEFKMSSTDVESYLRGLEMSVKIAVMDQYTIVRAAQMTQKTNQFNLTTKRYTAEQLQQMSDSGFLVLTLETADRFGHNGLTGLMALDTGRAGEGVWEIDTFLLSCRIMNREIERAFMGAVIQLAAVRGVETLAGRYIPTAKNMPVKDLYAKLGFTAREDYWAFHVASGLALPDYIDVSMSLEKSAVNAESSQA
jgi:FkbH-like protein